LAKYIGSTSFFLCVVSPLSSDIADNALCSVAWSLLDKRFSREVVVEQGDRRNPQQESRWKSNRKRIVECYRNNECSSR
jgi:hypothetical protein